MMLGTTTTQLLALLLLCSGAACSAPSGPWDSFNFAPKSRVVRPTAIHQLSGSIQNAQNLISISEKAVLANDSWIALDFGKEVGGLISMNLVPSSDNSKFSLSFTESPLFISPTTSDDSTTSSANMSYDGVLEVHSPVPVGFWTQPADRLRGGYRYLTIVASSGSIEISNVTCTISFAPHVEDLRDYSGYFYASDPVFHDKNFLTKLWYAGAYTVQTNTISAETGRQVSMISSPGWENNATAGVAGPIIVDGAKRDRAVWPGDMGIAVPTSFVSTNDLIPTRNSLSTLFAEIDPVTGALPYSGPPLSLHGSDTYHAWTLLGVYNYYLYSGDIDWLEVVWTNYTKAVQFLENKVTPSGLMNVTGIEDWGRLGGGGLSVEGNILLYKVLTNSAELANYVNATTLGYTWSANASPLKKKINEVFWVDDLGMYRDNETTTLCPQDANSLAILFDITTPEQANSISEGLTKNWNELGAVTPELPDTISPFVSGFELQAHFVSGNDDRAMDLLRREWGYMLYTNISVQSTLVEGFTANGSLSYRSYDGYNYDPSYTSHSHGWSTGPTSALTYYVLGLQVATPKGETWTLAPHLSGLSAAEGSFETSLGTFAAKWTASGNSVIIEVSTPSGTEGRVTLPKGTKATVDGKSVDLEGITILSISGGKHIIVASD